MNIKKNGQMTEKKCERCNDMFPATYRTVTKYFKTCREIINKEDQKRYFENRKIKEKGQEIYCTGYFEDSIYF